MTKTTGVGVGAARQVDCGYPQANGEDCDLSLFFAILRPREKSDLSKKIEKITKSLTSPLPAETSKKSKKPHPETAAHFTFFSLSSPATFFSSCTSTCRTARRPFLCFLLILLTVCYPNEVQARGLYLSYLVSSLYHLCVLIAPSVVHLV